MDEDQSAEETTFVVEEITTVIKEVRIYYITSLCRHEDYDYQFNYFIWTVESTIGNSSYQHSKINQWTSSIVESSLSQLTKLGKPFKYIVTCIVLQKNGAGLHTASSCFWDNSTDGTCTVRWENKTIYCIVSVFGLAI